jgi:hypothetical protein
MLRVGDTAEVHQECVTFDLSALASLPEAAFMMTIGETEASDLVPDFSFRCAATREEIESDADDGIR